MNKHVIFYFFIFSFLNLFGQDDPIDSVIVRKEYITSFAKSTPKIDADLNDDAWKEVQSITDFREAYPVFDKETTQKTEVKIIYDNVALYISAKLYDSNPDSIAKQMGTRDDDLNADKFRLVFDTYNTQQDAFDFTVTASGVQLDSRFSDPSYNAVWESKTKITTDGWIVEIKIPYSAIRFPSVEEHVWGFQITRSTMRNGEFDQWALTPRAVNNPLKYWGLLKGFHKLKSPVRLSLTPFITAVASHYPSNISGENNLTQKIVGGMDLKYGLNESYTLDVSLLPDFSQVQSDNLVKNLGAFEQQYDEQRPFFQENTDLFNKGDLFYSRRIGRKPKGSNTIYDNLQTGETVISNPSAAKLLNIAKISGRSRKGVGLGFLNAVLDNTYAIVRDSNGMDHKVLTEPFSNYNIAVVDKQLKNSSNAYLINTSVVRNQGYSISNVTGAGGVINNKTNTYTLYTDGALTNVFNLDTLSNSYKDNSGFSYGLGFGKTSGKFQYYLGSKAVNPTFNNNDMGVTREVNFVFSEMNVNFNQYVPFGKFISAGTYFNFSHQMNFTSHKLNTIDLGLGGNGTLKNFNNFYFNVNSSPLGAVDYYEPRTAGRTFMRTPNFYSNAGFNSDYRKKITFSANMWGGSTALVSQSIGYNPFFGFGFGPQFRATDKLTVKLNGSYSEDNKDRGFVADDTNGDIIFGVRYLTNVSYDFTVRYLFKNNLSLSVIGRHYWVRGDYVSFHNLSQDGLLLDDTKYNENHDFNYNATNVNMLFEWRFAPGSFASLSWKNTINHDGDAIVNSYSKNLSNTLNSNQLNTISLRILYYFDYLYLRNKSKKSV
jgi:hypothetical protein